MSTGMDDDLHDPRLRRALDHAPDRDAMPAAHTREAILKMAHNLAAASAPATSRPAETAPWWRRLFGGGSPRSRMPWNAAFATVLVATFVTVLWHREPVPDAQLDGEAQVAGRPRRRRHRLRLRNLPKRRPWPQHLRQPPSRPQWRT